MSGWALFAKEKRLELLQSGQLSGETLPEQVSPSNPYAPFVAISDDSAAAKGPEKHAFACCLDSS